VHRQPIEGTEPASAVGDTGSGRWAGGGAPGHACTSSFVVVDVGDATARALRHAIENDDVDGGASVVRLPPSTDNAGATVNVVVFDRSRSARAVASPTSTTDELDGTRARRTAAAHRPLPVSPLRSRGSVSLNRLTVHTVLHSNPERTLAPIAVDGLLPDQHVQSFDDYEMAAPVCPVAIGRNCRSKRRGLSGRRWAGCRSGRRGRSGAVDRDAGRSDGVVRARLGGCGRVDGGAGRKGGGVEMID